jgi:hypothetical protein
MFIDTLFMACRACRPQHLRTVKRNFPVNVASEITQDAVLADNDLDGLVTLRAAIPRKQKHIFSKTLRSDDPPDSSHRVVCPPVEIAKKQYIRDAKEFANEASLVVYPKSTRESAASS